MGRPLTCQFQSPPTATHARPSWFALSAFFSPSVIRSGRLGSASAALARLDAFSRSAAADEDGLDEGARDLLQRWAAEHEKVTELFRQKFQQPAPAPEAPAAEEAPK